jgi:hypothetical protein
MEMFEDFGGALENYLAIVDGIALVEPVFTKLGEFP